MPPRSYLTALLWPRSPATTIRTSRLDGRHHAERDAAQQSDREREPEDPAVDTGIEHLRLLGREERRQRADRPERDQHSERATASGDDQAFRQELTDEMPAAGAERDPNGDFGSACRRPRQEQAGDVGAGDRQHQRPWPPG